MKISKMGIVNYFVLKVCFPNDWDCNEQNKICFGMKIKHMNSKKYIWIKRGSINHNFTCDNCIEIVYLGKHWIIEIEDNYTVQNYESFQWEAMNKEIKNKIPKGLFWYIQGILTDYKNENFMV